MWYTVISGLGIGLFGSFHCIGMCGPLALSLPLYGKKTAERLLLTVSYNLGRAITYALLGLLLGLAGQQFFLLGYQQALTLSVGFGMLVLLFCSRYLPRTGLLPVRLYTRLNSVFGRLLQSANSPSSYLAAGMMNGLLPCGLVYLAAASAIATGNAWAGAALMFLFGMGTFPLMIALMLLGSFVSLRLRQQLRHLVPVFVCLAALSLIARGLHPAPCQGQQGKSSETMRRVQCHP